MSLFDSASLVVTPSGYKEDKLYSIKPTDGSGDLVVTRATTATRVNSAGLIEQSPYNLLQRSEQFENAAWLAGGSGAFVVTANSTTAPNGTLTADKLIAPLTNQTIRQNLANINTAYTLSIYLKTNSGTKQMRLFINDTQIESTVNVTSDWQRFTLSGTTGGTLFGSGRVGIANVDILDNSSFVYAWGAQLVTGSTAKEYFPTTDRLDVPRLDYTNSSCPSILVEPQRTNLLLRSEEFDNASWSKTFSSISANATTSPNGTLIADKLIEDTANNQHRIDQTTTSVIGTNTFSVFAKKSERDSVWLRIGGSGSYFDLTNGTISGTVGVTASIENYGNGWYKCIIVRTSTVANEIARINLAIGTNATYLGNGTSGLFIWGAQLETGSNATSYIPTIASSVTRNLDDFSTTNLISKGLIVNDYTLFLDITNPLLGSQFILDPRDVSNNRTGILRVSGTNATLSDITGGSTLTMPNALTLGKAKMCVKRTGNVISFFTNGVKFASTTTTTAGTINNLQTGVGNSGNSSFINSVILFPTALIDQECIDLTTL